MLECCALGYLVVVKGDFKVFVESDPPRIFHFESAFGGVQLQGLFFGESNGLVFASHATMVPFFHYLSL